MLPQSLSASDQCSKVADKLRDPQSTLQVSPLLPDICVLLFRVLEPNGYKECLPIPALGNSTSAASLWKAYSCAAPLLQYLIPLLLLSYLYWRIGTAIWWAKTPGQALRERDAVLLKNKKKVG